MPRKFKEMDICKNSFTKHFIYILQPPNVQLHQKALKEIINENAIIHEMLSIRGVSPKNEVIFMCIYTFHSQPNYNISFLVLQTLILVFF